MLILGKDSIKIATYVWLGNMIRNVYLQVKTMYILHF